MKKAILLLTLSLVFISLKSQTLAKNDALKLDADYYLMDKEFNKAKDAYLNILRSEPDNADVKYRVGVCYLNSEDEKNKAIPYLEDAAQKISEKYNPNSFKETNAPVDALFILGSAYRVNNELDKAIEAYNRFKEFLDPKDEYNNSVTDQYIRNCNLARYMLQHPVNVSMVNLGNVVNNAVSNYNAVLSGDGKTLIYTSPGRQGYEIFESVLAGDAWSAPKNITSVLATGKYMKTCDISNDGLTLLLVLDDPLNSDIYISHYSKGRWSKAETLSKTINSKANETHASISADGNTLYFTSDRKGGEGDFDIYKSERDAKGEWGKPVNLGPIVNTPFNEATPFVTDDGKTLFFSTEGHDGIGGYDIFRYDLGNPGAAPVNIGYPLNTTDNDLFFVPFGDGSYAYYSLKGPDSYGGKDIYQVSIPREMAREETIAAAASAFEGESVTEEMTAPVTADLTIPVPADSITTVPEATELQTSEETAVTTVVEPESQVTITEEVTVPQEEPTVMAGEVKSVSETFIEPATMISNDNSPVTEARAFTIQFMALRKPVDITFFNSLSDVTLSFGTDQWYRYTYGVTTIESEAERIKNTLVEKGFSDAFIQKKAVIPKYTIQLMAVPGPVVNLSRFKGINTVYVTRGKDSFCRYTTGEFETEEEAKRMLETLKNTGYNGAFVRRIDTL